ncbi:MAG: SpoIIAA family protein [Shimia sp.]
MTTNTTTHPGIDLIPTDRPDLHAFRIGPAFDGAAMEAMARFMNDRFDATEGKIDMLLEFDPAFEMSDAAGTGGLEGMKAQFRSLSNVRNYVVIGAPEGAAKMIEAMGKLIPVEARTYDHSEREEAWASLHVTAPATL